MGFSHSLDPQRTLANRAGYDALRHGEIVVFEPDLSALVRRNGKARGRLRNIHCPKEMFGAAAGNYGIGISKNSVYSIT
jgi:hypothetical protein